nr:DUF1345 domain-containing protein [Streptomyces sp. NP160]
MAPPADLPRAGRARGRGERARRRARPRLPPGVERRRRGAPAGGVAGQLAARRAGHQAAGRGGGTDAVHRRGRPVGDGGQPRRRRRGPPAIELAGRRGGRHRGPQRAGGGLVLGAGEHRVRLQVRALVLLRRRRGIDFSQEQAPAYSDFAYVAFAVGMGYSVPDVRITDPSIRKAALGHGLLSYLFGTVVVAVAVSLVAGLGQQG